MPVKSYVQLHEMRDLVASPLDIPLVSVNVLNRRAVYCSAAPLFGFMILQFLGGALDFDDNEALVGILVRLDCYSTSLARLLSSACGSCIADTCNAEREQWFLHQGMPSSDVLVLIRPQWK